MDQEAVLRAKVLLGSADRRVVRGPKAVEMYRLLTGTAPEVYGSKLAYVLVEAAWAPGARELPALRQALLDEAVEVARALDAANPYRAKVLARAVDALRAEVAGG
ncbi:hypothetical protein [Kitasatospora mediocidica]|uniref:hypothetical protein n=1 Tax=Kitasatospora mediocidica TaxID=58352 RepID=UPI00055CC6F5|nr:hypothetical protein [Kitasatospora mediocidica]